MSLINQRTVLTAAACEWSLSEFYTCGQPANMLIWTSEWDMYLCPDCYAEWDSN